jgi:hypothetical protein
VYLAPGCLSAAAPVTPATQSYATNPADGLSMSFDQYGTVAASPYIPLDQRAADEAGLTWRTPQLSEPLALTGDSVLHLAAASSASDTDWFAKLSDVAPDGSETIITEGFLRASHRERDVARSTPDRPWHTNTNPSPIEPGRYYDYDLAIWPTGYELGSGHRLQLRVTSYDFPTHLPGTFRAGPDNPAATSFQPMAPATNTISQGGRDPSYLRITALGAGADHSNSSAMRSPPHTRAPAACARSARLTYRLGVGLRRRDRVVAARIYVDRKLVRSLRGRKLMSVTVARPHRASFTVKIVTTLASGDRVTTSRRYHLCKRERIRTWHPRGRYGRH